MRRKTETFSICITIQKKKNNESNRKTDVIIMRNDYEQLRY